jgi:hypothetical protein
MIPLRWGSHGSNPVGFPRRRQLKRYALHVIMKQGECGQTGPRKGSGSSSAEESKLSSDPAVIAGYQGFGVVARLVGTRLSF